MFACDFNQGWRSVLVAIINLLTISTFPCIYPSIAEVKNQGDEKGLRWIYGTCLSDATMKTFGLTVKYFPLPQPISRPIDPAGMSLRNFSTIGHG